MAAGKHGSGTVTESFHLDRSRGQHMSPELPCGAGAALQGTEVLESRGFPTLKPFDGKHAWDRSYKPSGILLFSPTSWQKAEHVLTLAE